MKHIICLFIIFQAFGAFATDLVELPKPLCSDVTVRLSLKPVPCIPDGFDPSVFDIPGLKLNLEDLQKIFDGAESSGGHIIGPMNHPRRARPLTPFPFTLKCEARMLLDGKKKVSFLSSQSFELNQGQYELYLRPDQWSHNLIVGADIYSQDLISVDAEPVVAIRPFKVELSYNTYYDHFQLGVCEDKSGLEKDDLICAQSENSVRSKKHSVRLQKRFNGNGKVIHQTVQISCQKK
ncbi:MAG: hypothetical protein NXH75_03845 [Halobacteriovoraceae bacterium]|nr:hypothetical protein [Halobacteriovoraceae bacterium]